ncbi:MAG: iron-sulfur cluster assembly accessory protein [Acidobacteria bacterium]|nr:iron-sulfur cluster assembly accessory protein [Acidobacteriota bacterium]NIM60206.1 iron-sulfur cluster assembly accessory protein [Acidobacteriota bacterium]NIO60244.1 iron-sulfur cluster assembly accessory protein [Acidobacteriota bacterium]NIQ31299.1 iron-sulfur cluster assembly accessory protein [Acidobacteriota bacterium]NIQ86522.1 iron-sulfur cluster assembly accessory protein [Acidobacteriota bacterium]
MPRITLTEAAKKRFIEVTTAEERPGHGLRLIVRNGGTSRPDFALNFVEPGSAAEDDTVIDVGEFNVYVDAESAKYVEGASVDFIDNLQESGFKVDAPNAGLPRPTGPLAEAVMKVLDEKINPAVASHGGHVDLVAVENETAYLRFGGGCQGCGMAAATLKNGVEKTLFAEVPEIKAVMDVTDHASGKNPYYEA